MSRRGHPARPAGTKQAAMWKAPRPGCCTAADAVLRWANEAEATQWCWAMPRTLQQYAVNACRAKCCHRVLVTRQVLCATQVIVCELCVVRLLQQVWTNSTEHAAKCSERQRADCVLVLHRCMRCCHELSLPNQTPPHGTPRGHLQSCN